MSEPPEPRRIRRIVVALDASVHSVAALEAAALLAAAQEAELLGIFVEDADLLKAAALPFAQEVGVLAGAPAGLSSSGLRRQLRAQATRARRALEASAQRTRVRYTFRVEHGRVPAVLRRAAREADLLFLGRAGTARCSRRKLGTTARRMLEDCPVPVGLLRHGLRLGPTVVALHDGSADADTALELAALLASRRDPDAHLKVYMAAEAEAGAAARLREYLAGRLGARLPPVSFHRLERTDIHHLAAALQEERDALVVAPMHGTVLRSPRLRELLEATDLPILLV